MFRFRQLLVLCPMLLVFLTIQTNLLSAMSGSGPQIVFAHNGSVNTLAELNALRARIPGNAVLTAALASVKTAPVRMGYVATPTTDGIVSSGISGSVDHFAIAIITDATAAWAAANLYVVTGDSTWATIASNILLAWATAINRQNVFQGANWVLNAAWSANFFAPAAELLRASGFPGWTMRGPGSNIDAVVSMFNNAYLPVLHNRQVGQNRELAVISAMMAIGVFDDDPAAFEEGVNHYHSYVPAYYFDADTDGGRPIVPNYWVTTPSNSSLVAMNRAVGADTSWIEAVVPFYGDDSTSLNNALAANDPSTLWGFPPGSTQAYCSGYSSETHGRDLSHAEAAFLWTSIAAEIGRHQGLDLWGPYVRRLAKFADMTAYLNLNAPSNALCGSVAQGDGINAQDFLIAYPRLVGHGLPLSNVVYLIQNLAWTTTGKLQDPAFATVLTLGSPGAGYALNDVVTVADGGQCRFPPKFKVTSIDAQGGVTGWTNVAGTCITLPLSPAATVGGSGEGVTVYLGGPWPKSYGSRLNSQLMGAGVARVWGQGQFVLTNYTPL